MMIDLTERAIAEEAAQRIAAIVESSDDAILAKDLNGTIITWNASLAIPQLKPLEPLALLAAVPARLGHDRRVDEQPALAPVVLDELFADRGAVAGLVDDPPPLGVDDDPAEERAGRRDEPPRGDPAQFPGRRPGFDAHPDARAVVGGRAEREPAAVGRGVLAHHLAVGDEPARGEHDPASGGNPQLTAVRALEALDPAVQRLAQ